MRLVASHPSFQLVYAAGEEPVSPESIDTLPDVRVNSSIPIAAGERYFEPERFMELIYRRAVDILQPDFDHVGGMLEAEDSRDGSRSLLARGSTNT